MFTKKINITLLGLVGLMGLASWTNYPYPTPTSRQYVLVPAYPYSPYYSNLYYQDPNFPGPAPIAQTAVVQPPPPQPQRARSDAYHPRKMPPLEDMSKYFESKDEKKQRKKEERLARRASQKTYYRDAYAASQKNRLHRFAERDGFIWFYDKDNPHTYFLGNFYPCPVYIWGMQFRCAEAAFQAAKFANDPHLVKKFSRLDGEEAWKLAHKLSYKQRSDWYHVHENIMTQVLVAKFQQNPDLKDLLLATGNAYLVEHSDKDSYWADGGDGRGKNRLGHLLMGVRGQLGGVGDMHRPARYRDFVR